MIASSGKFGGLMENQMQNSIDPVDISTLPVSDPIYFLLHDLAVVIAEALKNGEIHI